jgi:hypothetical protein
MTDAELELHGELETEPARDQDESRPEPRAALAEARESVEALQCFGKGFPKPIGPLS